MVNKFFLGVVVGACRVKNRAVVQKFNVDARNLLELFHVSVHACNNGGVVVNVFKNRVSKRGDKLALIFVNAAAFPPGVGHGTG